MTVAEPAARSLQMNVRLDKDQKARGDAALGAMGFSPTDAVRALWSAASGSTQDLDDVNALLRRGRALQRSGQEDFADAAKHDLLEQGWSLYPDACARLGITEPPACGVSDDELLEQALLERHGEGVTV